MNLVRGSALVAMLFVVLAVAPAVSPVQLSFVYSDSMAPTIHAGSGYVLVPAGNVNPGEIVTFYADSRSEYVTHRVVAETARGFITKGDNNPVTDQATGLPPVDRAQVVGEVLVVAGDPVTIPHLASAVSWIRTTWPLLLACLALYALLGQSNESPRPQSDVLRTRDVVVPVFVGVLLMGVFFTVLSASHTSTIYVASAGAAGAANTLPVGETVTRHSTISLTRTPATRAVVTTDGMTLRSRVLASRATRLGGLVTHRTYNATLTVRTPPEPGLKRTAIHVYSYPRTLPRGVTRALTRIHPVLAGFATVLAGLAPFLVAYWLFFDPRTPVRLPKNEWIRRVFGVNER